MLLPVFSIAQPPTATVVFPAPWDTRGVGMFGDEQDLVLIPRSTAFSATVQDAQGLVGVLGDEQPGAIPYASQWMADIITHGTSMPPMWTVAECEDPEQEFGEAEMFLVNQFLWATSPQPARKITKVTRDSTGVILGGATVKLFRTDEDRVLEQEISDPTTGAFTLSVFDQGFYYYTAVKEASASSTTILASSSTVLASASSQVTALSANTLQGV
jgi:hypothetical protein